MASLEDIVRESLMGAGCRRARLMQMVGETGWQLSQGERSRLFLARALLQGAGVMVLDESFCDG